MADSNQELSQPADSMDDQISEKQSEVQQTKTEEASTDEVNIEEVEEPVTNTEPSKDEPVTVEEPTIENIEEPKEPTTTEEPQTVEEPVAAEGESTSVPRTKYYSVDINDPVELLIGSSGITAAEPLTVIQVFKNTVQNYPNATAYAYKEEGVWKHVTYAEYYDQSVAVAKSFLKLELEPFHSVGIIGFNSPEWFLSVLGAVMAGGVATGIYATNKPEVCKFIAEDSKADILVVEDNKQLEKILLIKDQLPNLKAIVQYKGTLAQEYPDVYEWSKFIELGANIDNEVVEKKIAELNPACCASLIYTSGTVGFPKGVMLSHDNITWTCKAFDTTVNCLKLARERIISYLPLSHIAAQFVDIFLMMYFAGTSYFAQPDALKGSLKETLQEVHPTVFVAVPRVWEKFMDAAKKAAPPAGSLKSKIALWAKGVGYKGNMNVQNNTSLPWGWTIANSLVFNKIKERFGLSEAKLIGTTAAPISRDVLEFFVSLNIPLLEVYGMSEGCGPVTTNLYEPGRWKLGTIGFEINGVEVKLDEKNENGEGELCFRGRNVMMGYHKNVEKTLESLDSEGWFHSGDLAVVDKDGFYSITGRKKELIITSGGENIAPVPIEDSIKREIPFVSNVMVVGERRNFLSCLLTLKCDIDPETGEPTDNLTAEAVKMIAAKGSTATKISQVIDNQDQAVFTAIEEGLERANVEAVSNAAKVKKWSLLDADFSEIGGELGPTQKLKRFFVTQKYAETIDALYDQ